MNKYIGFKMIEADKATRVKSSGQIYAYSEPCPNLEEADCEEGYRVVYPDGYVSWSPKDVFEKAYMQISGDNKITQEDVSKFIALYKDYKLDDKTTVVKATLVNGFEIVESSSCVDPKNYDAEIGINICLKKIEAKVWELLGFLLQTAKDGIK